jgi:hypothetical protein
MSNFLEQQDHRIFYQTSILQFWYMNFSCLTYGFIIWLAVAVVSEQLNYLTVDTLTAVVVCIKVRSWNLSSIMNSIRALRICAFLNLLDEM